MPDANKRSAAYWDFYDSSSGELLEEGRKIEQNSIPIVGGLVIGIPQKRNAIVRNFKFKGIRDGLPCYQVYV